MRKAEMKRKLATTEAMVLLFHSPKGSPFLTSLLLFLISSDLLLSHAPTAAADNLTYKPIRAICTGAIYAGDSPFQTNLKTLLSSLASHSSTSNSANATSGAGPDRAYGLYLCEGDLAHSDCQACIQTAAADVTQSCPSAGQGIIWYDYCLLRYSDRYFFGAPDATGFSMINPNENTSSPLPLEAVTNMVQEAPSRRPLMFASNASVASNLYAMAQCTADLTSDGCSKCLTTILADIKACCAGSNGWRYLAASCWIRYEATPFLRDLNGTHTEIVQYQCSNKNFSPAITTADSLSNLLSTVASNARPSGFYNTTTSGKDHARLYGLALCRADLPTPGDDCTNCLNDAGRALTGDCPNNTQGIIWYEKCLLRYSNQNFFGVVDDGGGRTLCGLRQVTAAANDATFALASRLVGAAPNSALMSAAGEATVGDSQSSYILAQCTRDLSSDGCKECLRNGMTVVANHCNQTNGWRYLSGSCTLRYEASPFFNTSVIASTPSAAQPTAPGKGGKTSAASRVAAVMVVPIVGVILLGPFLYY